MTKLNRVREGSRPLLTCLTLLAALTAAMSAQARVAPAFANVDGGTSTWTEQKVVSDDGAASDNFGYAVTISGTTAVVGASNAGVDGDARGLAYVYTLVDGTWTLQQEIGADDGAALDGFGFSVSLSGDTLVVGAPYVSIGDNGGEGAAYVFTRTGDTWTQVQKLEPDDGTSNFNFGWSVALSGSTALISSPVAPVGDNILQGKAYVFTDDGGSWSQAQTLVADDGSEGSTFGESVAIDGTTAVIGASGTNGYFGAAYVFDGSGGTWTQTGELVPDDGMATEFFGLSVAVSGSTALVGAYYQNVPPHNHQGSAYVFTDDGGTWTQHQKLTASDGAAGDRFGLSVALDGSTALVGAYLAKIGDNTTQGAAYVFSASDDGTWTESDKLFASDGASGDEFGNAVALSGDVALVAAFDASPNGEINQGAAYFYTRAADDAIFVDGFDGPDGP
jgi:hypothetical protein